MRSIFLVMFLSGGLILGCAVNSPEGIKQYPTVGKAFLESQFPSITWQEAAWCDDINCSFNGHDENGCIYMTYVSFMANVKPYINTQQFTSPNCAIKSNHVSQ